MLTNSLKYGFPDGSPGHINIELVQHNDHTLALNVSDNGVGLKKGARPQGTGFGSQLIRLLTQQLNGTMDITSEKGTVVQFNFQVEARA